MSKALTIAQRAQEAFWATVAEAYPDAKTGDFPPDATFAFNRACARAVETWVDYNVKEENTGVLLKDGKLILKQEELK